jgi:hypothetical protein
VTYSYLPNSSGGWSTITYIHEPTQSGYVTYVEIPTVTGVESYTESSSVLRTAHGTATELYETLSNGEQVTYVSNTGTY